MSPLSAREAGADARWSPRKVWGLSVSHCEDFRWHCWERDKEGRGREEEKREGGVCIWRGGGGGFRDAPLVDYTHGMGGGRGGGGVE